MINAIMISVSNLADGRVLAMTENGHTWVDADGKPLLTRDCAALNGHVMGDEGGDDLILNGLRYPHTRVICVF